MRGHTMKRMGCTLGLLGLLMMGTACSSTTESWAFNLEAGESWTKEIEGGDLRVQNQGPGSVEIVLGAQSGGEDSILAEATLTSSLTAKGDAAIGDADAGTLEVRNTSDKKTRLFIRLDR